MKDMLGTLVRRIVNLPLEMLGTICDLIEKLSSEAGQQWLAELKKFLRKENCWTGIVAIKDAYLKLISSGQALVIDACDGANVLADAKDVFAHIDPDFKNWKADQRGFASGETFVEVYEMKKDGTFSQMFGSLSPDLQKLCLTQDQIIGFVKKHREWLRTDGYGTFFLFMSNEQYFVAGVLFSGALLSVDVYRFEGSDGWYAGSHHRVVVPQLV
jgi:hypothetical protein